MTIQLVKLEEIGKEIRDQDNLATSDPIFVLYDYDEIVVEEGFDYDTEAWVCDDDSEIRYCSEEEALKEIKKEIKEGGWDRFLTPKEALEKAFTKHYIKRVPAFKQAFFNMAHCRFAPCRFMPSADWLYHTGISPGALFRALSKSALIASLPRSMPPISSMMPRPLWLISGTMENLSMITPS